MRPFFVRRPKSTTYDLEMPSRLEYKSDDFRSCEIILMGHS